DEGLLEVQRLRGEGDRQGTAVVVAADGQGDGEGGGVDPELRGEHELLPEQRPGPLPLDLDAAGVLAEHHPRADGIAEIRGQGEARGVEGRLVLEAVLGQGAERDAGDRAGDHAQRGGLGGEREGAVLAEGQRGGDGEAEREHGGGDQRGEAREGAGSSRARGATRRRLEHATSVATPPGSGRRMSQRIRRGGGVSGETGLVVPRGEREPGRKGALIARSATVTPIITSSSSPSAEVQRSTCRAWPVSRPVRRSPSRDMARSTAVSKPSIARGSSRVGPVAASSALTWRRVCRPCQESPEE